MESTATREDLLDLLGTGDLLLLPNSHAARELRATYDARQRGLGLAAWQPARAISWQQWTSSLYSELIVSGTETRLLLNAAQEQSLWQEIIAADPPPEALSSFDSLAELAAGAYALAAAWNATAQLRATATSEDTRTFARWAEAFETRCQREQYLSLSMLDAALSQLATLDVKQAVRLVGFAALTPSQRQLVDALRARGADVVSVNPTSDAQTKNHAWALCETPGEELAFAAQWLRKTLESADGSIRIAVLLPDPQDERAAFETVLRETVAEELESITADLSSTPWEFVTGQPLGSLAMVADALDLARWTIAPLSQTRISALLLSPYLNPGAERERSAQVDARLRRKERRLRPEMSLDAFVRLLDKHAYALAWPRQLQIEIARGGELARPRSYAAWMEFVRGVVQATGWPSSQARALNATEYEASRVWDSALDTVATLDFAGRRVSLAMAIEALERQVQATSFQPPSTNAAVQILRPEQAEGGVFDAVLFLHATDQNLPAPERTHPLLSLTLQNQMQMPGTDSARATERARVSVSSLLERTPNVLFLCAREDENGALRPSPLLAEFGLALIDADEPAQQRLPVECERFADDAPLPPLPTLDVHGGARVLQLQAACGFRAFAELRLGAGEPEETEIGLDARQSGGLVHKVLELLWQPRDGEMRTQQQLSEMSEAERREVLQWCIDEAVGSESNAPEAQWDAAYLSVVRERLLSLMSKWLEHELQRGPFTVLGVEHNETIPVGPLRLKVRVDRIDQVVSVGEAGENTYGSVLIDYKTGGSAHPNQWEGERPEEPQLPLYTQLLRTEENAPLMGMAFGKVIAGDAMRWHGLQGEQSLLPKAATVDMVQRIEEWGATLERLAQAFADGEADVAPKDPVKTCKHCGLQILCRVGELALQNAESDDEEVGDE